MMGKTVSPALAILKSFFQCLALPLTSLDAEVMATIGPFPFDSAASCKKEPSASPSGVHAPPMSTSVPARSTTGLPSIAVAVSAALVFDGGIGRIESVGIGLPMMLPRLRQAVGGAHPG